jgi:hypothetical protein
MEAKDSTEEAALSARTEWEASTMEEAFGVETPVMLEESLTLQAAAFMAEAAVTTER